MSLCDDRAKKDGSWGLAIAKLCAHKQKLDYLLHLTSNNHHILDFSTKEKIVDTKSSVENKLTEWNNQETKNKRLSEQQSTKATISRTNISEKDVDTLKRIHRGLQ